MFAHIRVLILAALVAGGLLATSGDAQAQHRRVYGVYSHGGHVPSYSHGYAPTYYHGGVYPAGYGYYSTPGYTYPATGYHFGGAAYSQPYSWHGGTVYSSPSHVVPRYSPYHRGYVIRH